jgi:hypothetical protein
MTDATLTSSPASASPLDLITNRKTETMNITMTIDELFGIVHMLCADPAGDAHEPTEPDAYGPCDECGTGYLLGQTYGAADIPDEWTPVQACDTCQVFDDDEDAARAAAAAVGVEVCWFPGVTDPEDSNEAPGDWAIRDNANEYGDELREAMDRNEL